ncbi:MULTISPECIES: hypothetical protein [Pedobacter]|nr:hypothetical protein [Pedobacter aquatilis]
MIWTSREVRKASEDLRMNIVDAAKVLSLRNEHDAASISKIA